MKAVRAVVGRLRRDERGEGPVGYVMVAAILGMLGVGVAPLMKDDVAKTFADVIGGLIQGVGGIFGL
jgi:hypothetical protein